MDEDLENKISQIIGALKGQFSSDGDESGSNEEDGGESEQRSGGFDMPDDTLQMMMKMKRMFDQQGGKKDPAKDLLLAISPFLKESRQERVGTCIKFLGMSKMAKYTDLFNNN